MKLVKTETLNEEVRDGFEYSFEIKEKGVYAIEMIARAKSWWQRGFRSFFNDDNLAFALDGREFPKLSGKSGLFDGEAAWNGNSLKGLAKTNLVFVELDEGIHLLRFMVDGRPELESISLFQAEGEEAVYAPQRNNPSEDRDRRPWVTVVLADLSLKRLSVTASAGKRGSDDDDIRLFIDGETRLNRSGKAHRNWYWCGRVLDGAEKTFEEDLDLEKGLHYVEFWADRMPPLREIRLAFGISQASGEGQRKKIGKVALYKDIAVGDVAYLRSNHDTVSDLVAELKDGTEVEIVEERVDGERVQNKSTVWHRVKCGAGEGYVLSSFVEIEGQERWRIVEKIRLRARVHGIDEDYAIALAGCESQYKPYAVSFKGAAGIFQLTGIARDEIAERFGFRVDDREKFDVDRNIEGGVLYLKWLFDYYQGSRDMHKKVTAAWNVGRSLIPLAGPIRYDGISDAEDRKQAEDLVRRVEANRDKRDWSHIFLGAFLFLLVSATIFDAGRGQYQKKPEVLGIQAEGIRESDIRFRFDSPIEGVRSVVVMSESPALFEWYTKVSVEYSDGRKEDKSLLGYLTNAFFVEPASFQERLVVTRQQGQGVQTSILAYDSKKKSFEQMKFIDQDGEESNYFCCGYVIFDPIKSDIRYRTTFRFSQNYESVYRIDPSRSSRTVFREAERKKVEESPES
jgi:hypothetical protein